MASVHRRSDEKASSDKEKKKMTLYLAIPFGAKRPGAVIKELSPQAKVTRLKTLIEQDVGILPDAYHLTYLDAAPLEDRGTLRNHDIVDGATLTVKVWKVWQDLTKAAFLGDHDQTLSQLLASGDDSEWERHRSWCALYTAAHRGHYTLVSKLIEAVPQISINSQSLSGWTALHAASRMGQWKVLCVLIDSGADVRITDRRGRTAFDLARKHGNKKCEKSLSFCQWNLQKFRIIEERKHDYSAHNSRRLAERQAHQFCDSTLTTWLRGGCGQLYMIQRPNPVSISEVRRFEREKQEISHKRLEQGLKLPTISQSPSRSPVPRWQRMKKEEKVDGKPKEKEEKKEEEKEEEEEEEGKEEDERGKKMDFNYGWFDPLRAQELIPSTHDVLTYANPSSSFLRPRSLLNPGGHP